MQKTALVTGADGFIGKELCKLLKEKGWKVKGFSNNPKTQFVKGDIRNYGEVKAAVNGSDAIFHLAGISSSAQSDADVEADFEINAKGTLNVLRAAEESRAKSVVFTSSAFVYGLPKKLPVKEDDPLLPNSFYGQSKLIAEEYCRFYARKGLHVVIARLFNAFGKGQVERVVPDLINKMRSQGDSVAIEGNSANSRDFLSVDQVSEALVLLSEKGKAGEAYNVGSGKETSMKELAEMILAAFSSRESGFKRKLVHNFDIRTAKRNEADISKLSALGFTPRQLSVSQLMELI